MEQNFVDIHVIYNNNYSVYDWLCIVLDLD